MFQILITSFILSFAVASQNSQLNYNVQNGYIEYQITSQKQLVVIGFKEQIDIREYLFCDLKECNCEDRVSKGPRSHPQLQEYQQVTNLKCTHNTISFERKDYNLTPYVWGENNKEEKSPNNQFRITQSNSTVLGQSNTTYTSSDLTASKQVNSNLLLKWGFIQDNSTIDLALEFSKYQWVGIGFGAGMNNVDMFCVNILTSGSSLQVEDLFATREDTPNKDSIQNIDVISYTITDSSVNVRIRRPLSTNDTAYDTVLTQNSTYTWSYATSNTLTMTEHTTTQEFSITLNTSGAQLQDSNTQILMSIILIGISILI